MQKYIVNIKQTYVTLIILIVHGFFNVHAYFCVFLKKV